jgi:photosynthetic reaction center H subunit
MAAITGYIDVAQVVLYAFWVFFFGLIIYLRREDKREGYPLAFERTETAPILNFPSIPAPKTFILPHGGVAKAPSGRRETREIKAAAIAAWPGAPLEPTGNPMIDAVGPGAYAERAEVPDLTVDGRLRIVPLRADGEFHVEPRDPDPRGMDVIGADREVAGKVTDIWVDRSESLIRYLEIEVGRQGQARRVLLPITFARVDGPRRQVTVKAILGSQFAEVPRLAQADQITRREEDKVAAYYASGTLYATPGRLGPLL